METSHFDLKLFCDTLCSNAQPKSVGYCARYVRQALQAAGVVIVAYPHAAYLYAKLLKDYELPKNEAFILGDIVVWDKTDRHKYGHIQALTEQGWVSDFKQRSFYPNWAKKDEWTEYKVFRLPDNQIIKL